MMSQFVESDDSSVELRNIGSRVGNNQVNQVRIVSRSLGEIALLRGLFANFVGFKLRRFQLRRLCRAERRSAFMQRRLVSSKSPSSEKVLSQLVAATGMLRIVRQALSPYRAALIKSDRLLAGPIIVFAYPLTKLVQNVYLLVTYLYYYTKCSAASSLVRVCIMFVAKIEYYSSIPKNFYIANSCPYCKLIIYVIRQLAVSFNNIKKYA
ncbi:uncharacterized protein BDR25DRAFT_344344 [Lindgomyces ingoldianus]|uniref:Uncharacterized protein n=1 Tax=Lindgomyces ingoldianus TaxID=673940 RepID=A0ACB6QQI5_9PLEO|nr:uncharacterized protein BDR25DRAFT_344344 [Lindgomyces ingoldianus]KAF2468365.1 hypothetical protein BDR25DRAFT_344344 [Lindgomyces ingoldianus]